MSKIHICNTFFESELHTHSKQSLKSWLTSSKITMQLQFLPLLYADKEDFILVTELPENPDPRLLTLDDPIPENLQVEDWGASLAIKKWAENHGASYSMPNWELIQKINSKLFSFSHSPKLEGAEILNNVKEMKSWLEKGSHPKVLKTPFGVAGQGHIFDPMNEKKLVFPLIGEPWVKKVQDFSSQWYNQKLLGITSFETNESGVYHKTSLGKVEDWAVKEHLEFAKPLIDKIAFIGYTGHIGIDAFIYIENAQKKVHPILEINARKTMSWIALKKKKSLTFSKSTKGLLPSSLGKIKFNRNIIIN